MAPGKYSGAIFVYIDMKLTILIAIAAAALSTCVAQTFEVASVKPATSGSNGYSGGCHGIDSVYGSREVASAPPLGRCLIHDARLSHMIAMAYNLPGMNMLKSEKAPDWVAMGADRFDVDAKAEEPAHTTQAQLLVMLQNLLIERFQMKFHREEKEIQGYALILAKGGPKFQESAKDDTEPRLSTALKVPEGRLQTVNAHKGTMIELAASVGFVVQQPVVDRTGLTGVYDFKLSFGGENGPEIFSALPDQLGLKLEGTKVPVSYFVVDSAKRPTAN